MLGQLPTSLLQSLSFQPRAQANGCCHRRVREMPPGKSDCLRFRHWQAPWTEYSERHGCDETHQRLATTCCQVTPGGVCHRFCGRWCVENTSGTPCSFSRMKEIQRQRPLHCHYHLLSGSTQGPNPFSRLKLEASNTCSHRSTHEALIWLVLVQAEHAPHH